MRIPVILSSVLLAGHLSAQEMRIISYNVESDADTNVSDVADDIIEIGGADIWGLQEVASTRSMFKLRDAMAESGRQMWFEFGLSGGGDRLAIVYDQDRFEAVEGPEELVDIGGSRPPLWVKLSDNVSGETFNVIVNHFQRGHAPTRRAQATKLREWLEATDEPSIILGDFNFDLEVPDWVDGEYDGNRAFNIFTKIPSPVLWVEHSPKISTQCSDEFDSVLDFVFLAGNARLWQAKAKLLFTTEQYCEDEKTGGADHRPIEVILDPSLDATPAMTENGMMAEIERIREQLDALEKAVRSR